MSSQTSLMNDGSHQYLDPINTHPHKIPPIDSAYKHKKILILLKTNTYNNNK